MEDSAPDRLSVLAVTLDVYEEVTVETMRAARGSTAARNALAHIADRAAREAASLARLGVDNFLWLLAKRIHARCNGCIPSKCRSCTIAGDSQTPRDYGRCCNVSRKALADRLTCVCRADPP